MIVIVLHINMVVTVITISWVVIVRIVATEHNSFGQRTINYAWVTMPGFAEELDDEDEKPSWHQALAQKSVHTDQSDEVHAHVHASCLRKCPEHMSVQICACMSTSRPTHMS